MSTTPETLRAKFEAWIAKDGGDLSTFGSGENMHYRNSAVNNAWTGWSAHAALAALASKPAPNLTPVIQWLENGCDPLMAAKELRLYQAATPAEPAPADQAQQAVSEGRTNRGDETGGAVKRFGWDCTGSKPEIIPATNGAFVWYSDYLELFKKSIAAQPAAPVVPPAHVDVLAERQRQISVEGWAPEHDDEHTQGELLQAAADLCLDGTDFRVVDPDGDRMIGWGLTERHHNNPRRQLVIAGALILAEIERLDRADHLATTKEPGK